MSDVPPSGLPEYVDPFEGELHQEQPIYTKRSQRPGQVPAWVPSDPPLQHPLEKLLGVIGTLLVALFKWFFGSDEPNPFEQLTENPPPDTKANAEPPKDDAAHSSKEKVDPEPASYPTEKPAQQPNPSRAGGGATPKPKNPLDELLLIEPEVRLEQAKTEIFDWQLNANTKIDPATAESITLMVEHGHEYAKQIIAPMSYFTLNYLMETIAEIKPGPESELTLVAAHIADAMEGLKQQRGQGGQGR